MFDKLIAALVVCTIFAAGLLASAGQALADEPIVTKAPSAALSTTSGACTSISGFFVTDCPLSWYGVRLYGTIDTGGGYQTHGAPLDPNYAQGSSYLVQKMNRQAMWTLAPGALSTSAVGVLVDEPFAPGWAFIGQLETSFDPYSLEFSNSPYAIAGNRGVPLNQQTAYSDSSRAGQFYNSVGYVGINSDTFGTITFFRVNALTLDAITAYDPMGGSYAFSALGFSSSNCGAGDSETCRITTAIKYRVNIGPIRLAALAQVGGYNQNNGSNGDYEGGNFGWGTGALSLDAIYK
jgi:predicted porin